MPKAEGRDDLGRNVMEQMSTTDLEKLLFRDFYLMKSKESGMVELYQAAQVLARRKEHTGFGADRSWEQFWEKYRALAGAEDGVPPSSDAAQGRRHYRSKRWWLYTALAALVLSISAAVAANGAWSGILTWWTEHLSGPAGRQLRSFYEK